MKSFSFLKIFQHFIFLTNWSILDMNVKSIAPICFYGNASFEIIICVQTMIV